RRDRLTGPRCRRTEPDPWRAHALRGAHDPFPRRRLRCGRLCDGGEWHGLLRLNRRLPGTIRLASGDGDGLGGGTATTVRRTCRARPRGPLPLTRHLTLPPLPGTALRRPPARGSPPTPLPARTNRPRP